MPSRQILPVTRVTVLVFATIGLLGIGCLKAPPAEKTPKTSIQKINNTGPLDYLPAPGSMGIDVTSNDGKWRAYEKVADDQSIQIILNGPNGTQATFKNVGILYGFSPDNSRLLFSGHAPSSTAYDGIVVVSLKDPLITKQITNAKLTWSPQFPKTYIPSPENGTLLWQSPEIIQYTSLYSGTYAINLETNEVTHTSK